MPQNDISRTYQVQNFRHQNGDITDANSVEFRNGTPTNLAQNAKRVWVDQLTSTLKYTIDGVDINPIANSDDIATIAEQFPNLQTAIDAIPTNGTLILKQGGSYSISVQLNLKSNITIDGNGATITQTANNMPIFSGLNVSNVTIRNCNLVGKGTDFVEADGRLAIGVYIKGTSTTCTNITVENNIISACTFAGVYFEKTQYFKANNNKVTGSGSPILSSGTNFQFGITPRINCQFGEIRNNEITQTAHGIYAGHVNTDHMITGNFIHDIIGQHGMYLTNGTRFKVTQNTVKTVNFHGIKFQMDTNNANTTSENTIVSENIVDGCGQFGISFENVDVTTVAANRGYYTDVQISNNNVKSASAGGYSLRHCNQMEVNDNIFDGGLTPAATTSYGIFLRNVQNAKISHNLLMNMGFSGVYFDTDATGVLYPGTDVYVFQNIIKEFDQTASTSHAGLYLVGNYTNLIIDGNYLTDKNALAFLGVFIIDVTMATTLRLKNNIVKDRGLRFNAPVTSVLEYDNNTVGSTITAFPVTLKKGRKATIYNGTIANAPVAAAGFLTGDRYEYTDPIAGGFIGKILIGATWKDYGSIAP